MTKCSVKSQTAVAVIICGFFLLVTLVQSQGLSQFKQDCGGCWTALDDSVNNVVRELAKGYRENDESIDDDGQPVTGDQDSQHEIFRRSAPVSTSLECRACWIVLNRLKSYVRDSSETDGSDYGRLVKKTMLNNGW